jgi:hypothetical protein
MSAGRWGHLSRLTESPTRVEVTEATRCDATPRHRRRQTCAGRSRTRRSCPSVTSNFVDNQRFSLPLALLDFSKPPAARLLSYLPGTIRRSERVARRRAHRMLAPGLIDGGRRCRTHAPQVQSLASATPRGHGPARRAAFRRSGFRSGPSRRRRRPRSAEHDFDTPTRTNSSMRARSSHAPPTATRRAESPVPASFASTAQALTKMARTATRPAPRS